MYQSPFFLLRWIESCETKTEEMSMAYHNKRKQHTKRGKTRVTKSRLVFIPKTYDDRPRHLYMSVPHGIGLMHDHQASFTRNYSPPLARAYCLHVDILFIIGALGILSRWNIQVYSISKARLGGRQRGNRNKDGLHWGRFRRIASCSPRWLKKCRLQVSARCTWKVHRVYLPLDYRVAE